MRNFSKHIKNLLVTVILLICAFGISNHPCKFLLAILEDEIDVIKKELTASHFARLADGNCSIEVSPYYSSTVSGLERVADHLVNIGYSIVNPIGSQTEV